MSARLYPIEDKRDWTVADPGLVRRRVWLCLGFLVLAFGGLLARLWYLQVAQGEALLAQALRNRTRKVPLLAPRGLVLDRRGVVLATSRSQHSVAVVPAALPSVKKAADERRAVLNTLGFLLDLKPSAIEAQLDAAQERGGRPYDPVRVAQAVDLQTITLIEENKWRLGPGVLVTDDIARNYPNGQLAAHVLGYTGIVTDEDMAATEAEADDPQARKLGFNDVIGKSGIEKEYDRELSGEPGSDVYEVDARSRPVARRDTIPPKPGHTLQLTLDGRLQRAAEDALAVARNSGAVAAIDPRNGAVLALASRPAFDPNIFSLPNKEKSRRFVALLHDAKNPLVDRAVTSRWPPGSTFKMVTAAAGLEQGTLHSGTVRHCAGGLKMGRFFGCWKTHGDVDLMGAIAGSCDVYFYQAALAMGNPESSGPAYLARIARQFGLGERTGIDLPSDGAGLIPDPEWRRRVNEGRPSYQHWFPGNTLNMSIGQGDVLATPLQMALVASAVANGGTLWQPHLLQAVQGADGKVLRTHKPQGRSVGIEPHNLELVRQGMRRVVTTGTGKAVALPQVEIAGKTGSAEDVHNTLPHAWFVCFAPYAHPTIAIAVIVENAGHGAENAAPIAKKILEAAFPAPAAKPTAKPR